MVSIFIIVATTCLLVSNKEGKRLESTNNAPVGARIDEHASSNNSISNEATNEDDDAAIITSLSTNNNNSIEGGILSPSPSSSSSSQPQIMPITATVAETPLGDIVEVLAAENYLSTWNAAVLATGLNLSAEGVSGGFGCRHIFTVFGMASMYICC